MAVLLLDACTTWIRRQSGIRIPVTVVFLLMSGLIAVIFYVILPDEDVDELLGEYTWMNMNPRNIMFAVLPILIFDSSFKLEAHEFMKMKWHILILAFGSFALASVLTGLVVYGIENYFRGFDDWTLTVSIMFGCMISATDPVAVVALLNELGAPLDLRLLIDGNSIRT